MTNSKTLYSLLCMLTYWLLSANCFALPEDNQQPINIQSDRASQKILEQGEKTEYFGNVQMTQGSLKINGEYIVIHSKDRKVTSIVATGNPVLFEQQSDPQKSPMKAQANKLQYRLKDETVILTDNASVKQDQRVISGKRIEYNIASEQIEASNGNDQSSRVKMVLIPGTSTASKQTNPPATESTGVNEQNILKNSKENNGSPVGP